MTMKSLELLHLGETSKSTSIGVIKEHFTTNEIKRYLDFPEDIENLSRYYKSKLSAEDHARSINIGVNCDICKMQYRTV